MSAKLPAADGIIFQAVNVSRARLLSQSIDPSVIDEHDPERRVLALDIFDPRNPNKPPFSVDYIATYRAAQLAHLRQLGGKEQERGILTHHTMADLRYVDRAVDPNDRPQGVCVGRSGVG